MPSVVQDNIRAGIETDPEAPFAVVTNFSLKDLRDAARGLIVNPDTLGTAAVSRRDTFAETTPASDS